MSRRTVIVALLPTLLLGVVCAYLYNEVRHERERARIEAELRSELQQRIANLDATRATPERELARPRPRLDKPGPNEELRVEQRAYAIAPPASAVVMGDANEVSAGMSAAQREWMQSPIARDLMRSHQREWIRRSSDDLFTLLDLSPEQSDALVALMADAQTPAFEIDAIRPIDPATLENVRNKAREQQRKTDQAIRELLGDEKYRAYQDYQNSAMERAQVDELQRLFEATPTPLGADQSAQLLAALKEERAMMVPAWNRQQTPPTPDELQRYQEFAAEYQHRVQERITSFLSPEQVERYNAFQRMQEAMSQDAMPGGVVMYGGGTFSSSSAVAIPE